MQAVSLSVEISLRTAQPLAEAVAAVSGAPTWFASAAFAVRVTVLRLTMTFVADLQVLPIGDSNGRPLVSTFRTPRRIGAIGAILFCGAEVFEAFTNTKCLRLVPVHSVFVALLGVKPRTYRGHFSTIT